MNLNDNLEHVKSFLRKQGPLDYYVQRNPLSAFEKYPFYEGLKKAELLHRTLTLPKASWYSNNKIESVHRENNHYRPHLKTYSHLISNELYINNFKFKFFSAYFDKGQAYWGMEDRKKGLLSCFYEFIQFGWIYDTSFIFDLKDTNNTDQIIHTLLDNLDISNDLVFDYLYYVLNTIKGWSAFVLDIEQYKEHNSSDSLVDFKEFVCILLIIEYSIYKHLIDKKIIMRPFNYEIIPIKLRDDFPEDLHQKYEKTLLDQTVAIINKNIEKKPLKKEELRPRLSIVTCIDDREESFRRYFELEDELITTFGYAGHFGLPLMYKHINDPYFRPQCPLGVTPKYYVKEKLHSEKITFDQISKRIHQITKAPLVDMILSFIAGPLSFFPFFIGMIYPKLGLYLKNKFIKRKDTSLEYDIPLEEGAALVKAMLITTGIHKSFAPVILLCGHGSRHVNNPHRSAYNCAACRGNVGEGNARVMANLANNSKIRNALKETGITIPDDTVFIPAFHDTCNEDFIPFDKIDDSILELCKKMTMLNAQERMKKFKEVPFPISPQKAYEHVQMRAMNMSIPRAEYGEAGKAITIVGDRELTRNINFDRRAFLVSYDIRNDLDGDILLNVLSAIVPVVSGIALEYFFSYTNNQYFGSGVKQPHNITSLAGVMNGYKSDLLLGLPRQMIELHRPIRPHIFVQTQLETMKKVLSKCNQKVQNTVNNEWARVIVCDNKSFYILSELQWVKLEINDDSLNIASTDPRGVQPFKIEEIQKS